MAGVPLQLISYWGQRLYSSESCSRSAVLQRQAPNCEAPKGCTAAVFQRAVCWLWPHGRQLEWRHCTEQEHTDGQANGPEPNRVLTGAPAIKALA